MQVYKDHVRDLKQGSIPMFFFLKSTVVWFKKYLVCTELENRSSENINFYGYQKRNPLGYFS